MKKTFYLHSYHQAFSLIELSIVLVILGLLTGGILSGQSLIRASELRAVTTEFQQWQTAVNTFKQKYNALPGDIPNATTFWGSASGASCSAGTSATGTGKQTCNGNGDGMISFNWNGTDRYYELFMFWQHLANAELINGTYTGKDGGATPDHAIININVPASKLTRGGWSVFDDLLKDHPVNAFKTEFGSDHSGWPLIYGGNITANELHNPILFPEEAWNIDKKIDDGLPFEGIIVSRESDCISTTTTPVSYNLTNNANDDCNLLFRH